MDMFCVTAHTHRKKFQQMKGGIKNQSKSAVVRPERKGVCLWSARQSVRTEHFHSGLTCFVGETCPKTSNNQAFRWRPYSLGFLPARNSPGVPKNACTRGGGRAKGRELPCVKLASDTRVTQVLTALCMWMSG